MCVRLTIPSFDTLVDTIVMKLRKKSMKERIMELFLKLTWGTKEGVEDGHVEGLGEPISLHCSHWNMRKRGRQSYFRHHIKLEMLLRTNVALSGKSTHALSAYALLF